MSKLIKRVAKALRQHSHGKKSNLNRRRNVYLRFDELEERCVPAVLIWDAEANSNVKNDSNWLDASTGVNIEREPAAGDTLKFTGESTKNAIFDMPEIAGLIIENGYTGKIEFHQSNMTLSITDTFQFNSVAATIEGYSVTQTYTEITLTGADEVHSWTGGNLKDVILNVGTQSNQDVELGVSDIGAKWLENSELNNFGTVTLSTVGQNAGEINLRDAIIRNYGYMGLQDTVVIADDLQVGAGSLFFNQLGSDLYKAGSGTATIEADFRNSGTFEIEDGSVAFAGNARQAHSEAVTRLFNGSRIAAPEYRVFRGLMEGDGYTNGLLIGFGATLRPGLGTTLGTIRVEGQYTQDDRGVLELTIDAAGNHDQLLVTANVELGEGLLYVDNRDYAPNQANQSLRIIDYNSIFGQFANVTIDTPFWTVGNQTFFLQPSWNQDAYSLTVREVAAGNVSIGDFVFNDADGDGVQDVGELGFANATVHLHESTNGYVGSTISYADGFYGFYDLAPGQYQIVVDQPGGYEFSPQDQGGDDALDSDVDVYGASSWINVSASQSNHDVDVGVSLLPGAQVAGFVWVEDPATADGIQDPYEVGLAGVMVELYDQYDNLIATTFTNTSGHYEFFGVADGDYYLKFTQPSGFDFTLQDQGQDDTLDSDADALGLTALFSIAGSDKDDLDAGLIAV